MASVALSEGVMAGGGEPRRETEGTRGVSGGRVWTGGEQLCEGVGQVEDSGGRGHDR